MFSKAALPALFTSFAAVAAQTCHDYVLISTRGTYELQGPSIGFVGMINQTLRAVPNGIEYDTVYPAAADQTSYTGANDIVRYIDAGLQSCPNQKYALLGYSQGASATSTALKNYTNPSSAGYNAIKAILLIGDPSHKSGEAVNVDQNGGTLTKFYNGALYNNMTEIPAIFYTDNKLIDICYEGDTVCALGYPNGMFIPDHLKYGPDENVQNMGAKFLIARLSNNGTVPTSTAASTVAPTGTGMTSSTTSPTAGTTTTSTKTSSSPAPTYTGAATSIVVPSSSGFFAVVFGAILASALYM